MLRSTVKMFKAFDSFQTSTSPLCQSYTIKNGIVTWIQTYCRTCKNASKFKGDDPERIYTQG